LSHPISSSNRFQKLIDDLAKSCHGSHELIAIKAFLSTDLKKTSEREAFLLPKLAQAAITWDAVKESVWPDPAKREANRFPFLQGDVIGTTTVLALGIAESSQLHDLWLVLSPDCDCVRSAFVRVAPVFAVHKGSKIDNDRSQRLGYSLKLGSPKAFPLPPLPGDDDLDLRGYFADLEEPYFITAQDKALATQYASMTIEGWHLLNGLIQENETRAADIAEATAIRTHVQVAIRNKG